MNQDRPQAKGELKAAEPKADRDANRDPLSGAPGAHPVGTGIGAVAGGMAAGAAAGSVTGPVGTLVGAAVGAVAGGLAGKGIAELVDPTAEDAFWRKTYSSRPYYDSAWTYEDYGPAYGYALRSFDMFGTQRFDTIEPDLEQGWEQARGQSRLNWKHAREATRDAWNRLSDKVERAVPGDSDHDGR